MSTQRGRDCRPLQADVLGSAEKLLAVEASRLIAKLAVEELANLVQFLRLRDSDRHGST
jgi:hypothetical protein